MRCDEIEQALNGEMADFKAAARHISKCPYCRKIYKDELEMEYSLRDFSLKDETVDILPDLYQQLDFKQRKIKTSVIIKRWAWLTSVAFFFGIVYYNINTIIETINKGLVHLMSWKSGYAVPDNSNLNQIAESFKSSDYFHLVLFIVAGSAAVLFYYLWREFKEIAK